MVTPMFQSRPGVGSDSHKERHDDGQKQFQEPFFGMICSDSSLDLNNSSTTPAFMPSTSFSAKPDQNVDEREGQPCKGFL
jgi:hypothetical protein